MFYGKYEHCLDDKNRLRLPKCFKEELGEETPSIAKGEDGSLVIYPARTINLIGEKIRSLGIPKEKHQAMLVFLSNIYPIVEDNQKRFTLNSILREHAGISKEVVFIGECDRIVLWDKDKWNEYEAQCPQDISLDEYGI